MGALKISLLRVSAQESVNVANYNCSKINVIPWKWAVPCKRTESCMVDVKQVLQQLCMENKCMAELYAYLPIITELTGSTIQSAISVVSQLLRLLLFTVESVCIQQLY